MVEQLQLMEKDRDQLREEVKRLTELLTKSIATNEINLKSIDRRKAELASCDKYVKEQYKGYDEKLAEALARLQASEAFIDSVGGEYKVGSPWEAWKQKYRNTR